MYNVPSALLRMTCRNDPPPAFGTVSGVVWFAGQNTVSFTLGCVVPGVGAVMVPAASASLTQQSCDGQSEYPPGLTLADVTADVLVNAIGHEHAP